MSNSNPMLPTPNPNPTMRTKCDRRAVEQRRLAMWEMLCCGTPVGDIARHFEVSPKTIQRDKAWWEERLGYGTKNLKDAHNAAIDVGMTAKKLEKIAEDAYVEYAAATNGAIKVRFLQTAVMALTSRHKVLADAGYLPKVGHEKETATKVQISFEQRFGKEALETVFDDPKSRRRVLEAAYSMVQAGLLSDKDVVGLPLAGHQPTVTIGDPLPEPGDAPDDTLGFVDATGAITPSAVQAPPVQREVTRLDSDIDATSSPVES